MAPIHVSGAEGETVEFKCSHPDDYKYTPKYFCRDPCRSRDVLITSRKSDEFVSVGRYSVFDSTNAKAFSVMIKNLQLRDAGVYYCGLDQWGRDTLTKVVLKVRGRTGLTPAPSSAAPKPTTLQQAYSSTLQSTGDGSETSKIRTSTVAETWSNQSASSTTHTSEPLSG